jgi:hypothetical protein
MAGEPHWVCASVALPASAVRYDDTGLIPIGVLAEHIGLDRLDRRLIELAVHLGLFGGGPVRGHQGDKGGDPKGSDDRHHVVPAAV